mmetsp:Transcript_6382/g.15021  ORF Transcript_6382/g.15021 Transcript_6382/m.15021 type:complete len:202 (-) Transcript_6382:1686-2291(-)
MHQWHRAPLSRDFGGAQSTWHLLAHHPALQGILGLLGVHRVQRAVHGAHGIHQRARHFQQVLCMDVLVGLDLHLVSTVAEDEVHLALRHVWEELLQGFLLQEVWVILLRALVGDLQLADPSPQVHQAMPELPQGVPNSFPRDLRFLDLLVGVQDDGDQQVDQQHVHEHHEGPNPEGGGPIVLSLQAVPVVLPLLRHAEDVS